MKNSILALSALVFMASCASVAQEAKPVSSAAAKPAPDTAAAASKKVQLLFVQNAKNVMIKGNTMTLQGVSPVTIFFADRPDRITGHMLTSHFIKLWSRGSDNFTADPPNATLSVLSKNKIRDAVMELRNPRIKGDALTYEIKLLQGAALARGGTCSLFIDALGEPLTPGSYAGMNRRMYRRGDAAQYDDMDDGSDIVPHDDATRGDDIDRGSDIVPHDDTTEDDDMDDGSDIEPHDDATRRDDIDRGRDIVPHDDATKRDDIDDGSDIVR